MKALEALLLGTLMCFTVALIFFSVQVRDATLSEMELSESWSKVTISLNELDKSMTTLRRENDSLRILLSRRRTDD